MASNRLDRYAYAGKQLSAHGASTINKQKLISLLVGCPGCYGGVLCQGETRAAGAGREAHTDGVLKPQATDTAAGAAAGARSVRQRQVRPPALEHSGWV